MDWQTQIKSTTVNRFKQKKGSIKNNYTEKRRKIIRVKMRSANFWYFSCHRKQEKKKQAVFPRRTTICFKVAWHNFITDELNFDVSCWYTRLYVVCSMMTFKGCIIAYTNEYVGKMTRRKRLVLFVIVYITRTVQMWIYGVEVSFISRLGSFFFLRT